MATGISKAKGRRNSKTLAYARYQDWFPWWSDSGLDSWWFGDAVSTVYYYHPSWVKGEEPPWRMK